MKRILGLIVAIVVPLSLATTVQAQTTYYGGTTMGPNYGATVMPAQPYGGFGLQYSPAIPAGGVIVDQWGGLHAVGYATVPSSEVVVQTQPRVMMTRRGSRRMVAQPRYQLPTGSLGWSGGNGGILYSEGARYSSYGSGYSVGPYGVVDHNIMWKW
jgi:hypothetical protein